VRGVVVGGLFLALDDALAEGERLRGFHDLGPAEFREKGRLGAVGGVGLPFQTQPRDPVADLTLRLGIAGDVVRDDHGRGVVVFVQQLLHHAEFVRLVALAEPRLDLRSHSAAIAS
jgi:hypothetical protein